MTGTNSYVEEYSKLAELFSTAWNSFTPVAWGNLKFEPTGDTPWIRFNVEEGLSSQASIGSPGSNYFRYVGIIDIQIFTPPDTGTLKALTIADKIISIFHDANLEGFIFSPGYTSGGEQELGTIFKYKSSLRGWYQKNVRIPYTRDSFK